MEREKEIYIYYKCPMTYTVRPQNDSYLEAHNLGHYVLWEIMTILYYTTVFMGFSNQLTTGGPHPVKNLGIEATNVGIYLGWGME